MCWKLLGRVTSGSAGISSKGGEKGGLRGEQVLINLLSMGGGMGGKLLSAPISSNYYEVKGGCGVFPETSPSVCKKAQDPGRGAGGENKTWG